MLERIWWYQRFRVQHFMLNLGVKYSSPIVFAKWQKGSSTLKKLDVFVLKCKCGALILKVIKKVWIPQN